MIILTDSPVKELQLLGKTLKKKKKVHNQEKSTHKPKTNWSQEPKKKEYSQKPNFHLKDSWKTKWTWFCDPGKAQNAPKESGVKWESTLLNAYSEESAYSGTWCSVAGEYFLRICRNSLVFVKICSPESYYIGDPRKIKEKI